MHPCAQIVRSPSGQLLSSGLRVRMGLHYGEPVFIAPASALGSPRAVYHGPVIDIAKRVAHAAHGGQIIATDEAWQQFCPSLAGLGSPEVRKHASLRVRYSHLNMQILDLGRHCLVEDPKQPSYELRQVTPVALAESPPRRRFAPQRYAHILTHTLTAPVER